MVQSRSIFERNRRKSLPWEQRFPKWTPGLGNRHDPQRLKKAVASPDWRIDPFYEHSLYMLNVHSVRVLRRSQGTTIDTSRGIKNFSARNVKRLLGFTEMWWTVSKEDWRMPADMSLGRWKPGICWFWGTSLEALRFTNRSMKIIKNMKMNEWTS